MEHHVHHFHHNTQFQNQQHRFHQQNMRRAEEARMRARKPDVRVTVSVPVKVSDTVVGLATIAAVGYGLYRLFK